MEDIHWLRQRIDEIDPELLRLFFARMEVCEKIGAYKKERGLPVYDAGRELTILNSKTEQIKDPKARRFARAFFSHVMDMSKDLQLEVVGEGDLKQPGQKAKGEIAYCGVPGAFGHEAAVRYFGPDRLHGLPRFGDVARGVLKGDFAYGVLPIENSTYGSVLEVYDLLLAYPVYIVGEAYVKVRHCLLGTGKLEEVKTVTSHPQALHQCSRFLDERGYGLLESANTALAAREAAKQGDPSLGVIASAHCGALYGLNVLREDIANSYRNRTRFIVIGRELEHQGDYEKASLSFQLPHEKGALYHILEHFQDCNLTKIESRPKGEWEYSFYLDFEGGEIRAIIDKIKGAKLLGLYWKGDQL